MLDEGISQSFFFFKWKQKYACISLKYLSAGLRNDKVVVFLP